MRSANDLVNDMLRKKCDAFAILAVARQARGGGWYRETESILREKNLLTDEKLVAKRTGILNVLKGKWRAERISWLKRIKDDAAIQARRESEKNDHVKNVGIL